MATIRVCRIWQDGPDGRFWDRVVLVGDYGRTDPMRESDYSPGRGIPAESFVRNMFAMRPTIVLGPRFSMGAVHAPGEKYPYQVLDLHGHDVVRVSRLDDLFLFGWQYMTEGPETEAETAVSAEVVAEQASAEPLWRLVA